MSQEVAEDHEARFEQLRRRVLELHGEAARLEAALPDVGPPPADDEPGSQETQRIDVTAPTPVAEIGELPADPGAEEDPDAIRELSRTLDELVTATDAMLALQDRLPVLRDVPARAWSVQIVRASALAVLLGAVLLGLGIWRDILGAGWLPVPLLMLPVAVRMALLTVAPASGRHRRQRYSAATCGAAALLVAPVAAVYGWLPGVCCVVVFAVALGVLLEVRWGRS